MSIYGWRIYNHIAIPVTPLNKDPDTSPIKSGHIWKQDKWGEESAPLLARWTTDFDCGYETNWWYVIKDTPFDISALKAKRRYEVNKGLKNFKVEIIDPCKYKEELYDVQICAFSAYPLKYRPKVDKEKFIREIDKWSNYTVFGAFYRKTNKLVGYAYLSQLTDGFLNLNVLKTNPEFERYAVNAALVEKIVSYNMDNLLNGAIICDGSRSINHETNFQNYLEKYFGFRKAYCKLHIAYNPRIKWIIKMLFPFRRVLQKFDDIGFIHQVNAVLFMEYLYRNEVGMSDVSI